MTSLFLFIYGPIRDEKRRKICKLLSLSRWFSSSLPSSFPSLLFAENFYNFSFFLLSRCVSCIFTLVFMLSLDGCWWGLLKSLEMFDGHEFMFNWCGISRVWSCLLIYMKELRSAENRTHRVCMSFEFSGFNTDVFAFLWYLFINSRLLYENSRIWITSFRWV